MLGIIGAMDGEVRSLKNQMENIKIMEQAKIKFYEGTLFDYPVVVVQSGIGKVNAAICTQILADTYHVDAVINTGIAGSLNSQIDIGDIVLSNDVVEHDVDATGFGYPVGQIPQMDSFSFVADEDLRTLAKKVCKEVNKDISVFEGRIVTGDQFIVDTEKKNWLIEKFEGLCTEMEGAAIGHTAYLNHIPFLIIRAISDKADNSAMVDYATFEKKAIENSVKLVCGLCKELVNHA